MSTVLFPLGPYHPSLVEPFGLVLRVRGETVSAVEDAQVGYCHRDVLACADGQPVDDVLVVVERSCSFSGHAHRLAVCQAIEDAQGLMVSEAAGLSRTLFAEVERMLARLWLLARTASAFGQHALAADALEQREVLLTAAEQATGQRMFWGIAIVGGARGDVDPEPLGEALAGLTPTLDVWQTVVAPAGRLGRLSAGVAPISAEHATRLRLDGIAATALGAESDERRVHPTEGYAILDVSWPDIEVGKADMAARLVGAVNDLASSHEIALGAVEALSGQQMGTPADGRKLKAPVPGHAQVQGPHGCVEVSLQVRPDGTVTDLVLRTPSERVLAALPLALEGARLALVPAILASLDLCLECVDL